MANLFDERLRKRRVVAIAAAISAAATVVATTYMMLDIPRATYTNKLAQRIEYMNMILLDDEKCRSNLRMGIDAFNCLCALLKEKDLLKDTKNCPVEKMVMRFLHMLGHHVRHRVLETRFYRSRETISRQFGETLSAILKLYKWLVADHAENVHRGGTPLVISNDPRFTPYFKVRYSSPPARQMSSSSSILISTNNTVVASADCNLHNEKENNKKVDIPMTSEGGEAKVSGGGEQEVPKKRKWLLCNGNINLLSSCSSYSSTSIDKTFLFNDSLTTDVELHLYLYDDESNIDVFDLNDVHLYLHSDVLRRRSQYFSALLSDQWEKQEERESSSSSRRVYNLTYKVSASMKSIDTHRIVIELLYSNDDNFHETINTVSSALSILPVAMEFMFEDCVKACIRLIEALPWTEEEEGRVLDLIPLLKEENSQELISRVSLVKNGFSYEMLLRLIKELRHNPHQKDFVAIMLRDFSSRDSIRLALNQAFDMTLESLKEALQSACSSKVLRYVTGMAWVPKDDEDIVRCDQTRETITIISEEEGKTMAHYGDFMCWLVDRMIERRVANTTTLDKWIDHHGSLSENFQKVCSVNIISPKFLFNVALCTWKLANAVAIGSIVADRQVRISLLKVWLPVMLHVKDMVLKFLPEHNHRFGEPFVKIISTLPMSESKELLLQCLGFSSQNVCPHLVAAYKTWFRRATTQPPKDSDSEEIPPNVVNLQQPTDCSSPISFLRSWMIPCD